MAETFGPFDGVTWSQAQWYRYAPAWAQSGVLGSAPVSSSSGDLAFSASGLTISLAVGRAWVRGAGYELTATPWTATAVTNTNTNPRIDRVVIRRDLSAQTVHPAILQGTPAGSPVAPSLTQVETGIWEEKLFSFQVPASSGTTLTNIVDERNWLSLDRIEAKVWRTSGFSSPLTDGVRTTVDFNASRLSGGFTFNDAANTLTVPANGTYNLRSRGYVTNSASFQASYRVVRQRVGVADKDIIVSSVVRKVDATDEMTYLADRLPLQAGDKLLLQAIFTGSSAGEYWGSDEANGVYLAAEYSGPLLGATPV